jgi:hypothetical protein
MHTIRHLFVVLGVLGVVFALVATSSQSSNCGGNSAALHVCSFYPLTLLMQMSEQGLNSRDSETPNTLTSDLTSADLAQVFESMNGSAEYSIRNPDSRFPAGDREVVIVCDVEFGNVPQPTMWNLYRRSPAYAIGFANGTSELITPAEYGRLDRSNFITVREWIHSRSTRASDSDGVEESTEREPGAG